ncbi:hypothetical protein AVEN_44758-1 [Araneus ventricosus]|uniref:Uncharacterized protein n=1 Tax=Araneus ventricosus TaxID=182803 RepID=A0A4Y2HQS7_ARAVE|nr:hypothetical protein AVEN_44758-1 [Araneus ventricosus]
MPQTSCEQENNKRLIAHPKQMLSHRRTIGGIIKGVWLVAPRPMIGRTKPRLDGRTPCLILIDRRKNPILLCLVLKSAGLTCCLYHDFHFFHYMFMDVYDH